MDKLFNLNNYLQDKNSIEKENKTDLIIFRTGYIIDK